MKTNPINIHRPKLIYNGKKLVNPPLPFTSKLKRYEDAWTLLKAFGWVSMPIYVYIFIEKFFGKKSQEENLFY